MAKTKIGGMLNTVAVDYADGADAEVEPALITALKTCIKSDIAAGQTLTKIHVSATTNGKHAKKSLHYSGHAVDISRIDGKWMSLSYPSDAAVKAIVDAIQDAADKAPRVFENFGPSFKHRSGKKFSIGGHKDHIHLSVK
jgi:hypothetical protein